jgi:methylthioribose-1-phosphate isomerase
MNYTTVSLDDEKNAMVIIDQTKLPADVEVLYLTEQKEIWDAIYNLKVRGAPAIGVAAAIGVYLAAKAIETDCFDEFYARFAKAKEYLASARPTAVNLFWALDRMERVVIDNSGHTVAEIKVKLRNTATEIYEEDIRVCRLIGEHGLELIKDGDGILTHCNAGELAAVKYGTALAPIYLAAEHGMKIKVFAGETRPLLQGARLTAFELTANGIDVTLICDNMASQVMKNGWVQAVFVGSDRIAANGDVCNKIGTSGVAVLARYYGIPFYVCAPSSTIDMNTETGGDIPIEQRPPEEVTEMWYSKRMTSENVKVFNPAFDVTDNALVTAIVTEHGIIRPPYRESLREINNPALHATPPKRRI